MSDWPAVNDHVVKPESGKEMIAGEIRDARGVEAPHAQLRSMIAAVLYGSVAEGYQCAVQLLTRFAHDYDFAADVSIRKEGIDPATGVRYLEDVVFLIKYAQSMEDINERARVMAARGVRRIFVVSVSDDSDATESMVEGPV